MWQCFLDCDLEDLGAQNWREIVQNWDKWEVLVMAEKTILELWRPEEEEEEEDYLLVTQVQK